MISELDEVSKTWRTLCYPKKHGNSLFLKCTLQFQLVEFLTDRKPEVIRTILVVSTNKNQTNFLTQLGAENRSKVSFVIHRQKLGGTTIFPEKFAKGDIAAENLMR